jgi:hypothetical protein
MFEIVERAQTKLPQWAQQAWRWQLFWLRAAIDLELWRNDGASTGLTERYMDELATIYYATRSNIRVTPPTRKALFRIIKRDQDLVPG